MTDRQEENLRDIKQTFELLADRKYRAGDAEHKSGDLRDKSILFLLNSAIDEAIDQVVYLLTLKFKLTEGHDNDCC